MPALLRLESSRVRVGRGAEISRRSRSVLRERRHGHLVYLCFSWDKRPRLSEIHEQVGLYPNSFSRLPVKQ